MNRIFMLTVLLTIIAGGVGSQAQAKSAASLWALSPQEIRVAYPTAAPTGVGGGGFEIKAATLAGVRWSRIELRFDKSGQLVHLKLWTRDRTYDQLESDLADSNGSLWAIGSDDVGRAAAQKVMLCDYGASGVALTFDQPSVALPKTITASIGSGLIASAAR